MGRHRRRSKRSGPVGRGKNPCGYCLFHRATLTVRQLENHKCLRKQCKRLVPYRGRPYWERKVSNG